MRCQNYWLDKYTHLYIYSFVQADESESLCVHISQTCKHPAEAVCCTYRNAMSFKMIHFDYIYLYIIIYQIIRHDINLLS